MEDQEYKRLVRIILVSWFFILLTIGVLTFVISLRFKNLQHQIEKLQPTTVQSIQGLPGLQGLQGIDGISGLPGKDGANGFSGKDGAVGAMGQTGATGAQGKPGKQGTPGAIPVLCKLADGSIGQVFPGDIECSEIGT